MNSVRSGTRWLICWAVLLGVGPFLSGAAAAENPPSASEVLQKAVARAQKAQGPSSLPGYSYTKATVMEEFDVAGNVKERKEKLYQVFFRNGSTYVKLLAVDGRPPPEAELKKQAENDGTVRQMFGQSKAGRGDNRECFLTAELIAHFDFTMAGQKPINGRPAYQIAFRPKYPEPPVRHIVDRFLNRISGTIWVDAEEYEIARAEIHLASSVEFLGGIIGSLKKLAYTMTRTRVAEGLWLNTFSSGEFEGRKLFDSMRIKTKSRSINFKPLV